VRNNSLTVVDFHLHLERSWSICCNSCQDTLSTLIHYWSQP